LANGNKRQETSRQSAKGSRQEQWQGQWATINKIQETREKLKVFPLRASLKPYAPFARNNFTQRIAKKC
jgi:hypothetical protein